MTMGVLEGHDEVVPVNVLYRKTHWQGKRWVWESTRGLIDVRN